MCVDPVHPLHRPTNDFPTVSLDQLTVILSLKCCIRMFINFYIAKPTYCFILMYTCGLTVVSKRIRYVMLALETASRGNRHCANCIGTRSFSVTTIPRSRRCCRCLHAHIAIIITMATTTTPTATPSAVSRDWSRDEETTPTSSPEAAPLSAVATPTWRSRDCRAVVRSMTSPTPVRDVTSQQSQAVEEHDTLGNTPFQI